MSQRSQRSPRDSAQPWAEYYRADEDGDSWERRRQRRRQRRRRARESRGSWESEREEKRRRRRERREEEKRRRNSERRESTRSESSEEPKNVWSMSLYYFSLKPWRRSGGLRAGAPQWLLMWEFLLVVTLAAALPLAAWLLLLAASLTTLVPPPSWNRTGPRAEDSFAYRAARCNGHMLLGAAAASALSLGSLVFRACCCCKRRAVKAVHALLQLGTAGLLAASLLLSGCWSCSLPRPYTCRHLWSAHAWLGLGLAGVVAVQWPAGAVVLCLLAAFPGRRCSMRARAQYVGYHALGGLLALVLAYASTLTGFVEYQTHNFRPLGYSNSSEWAAVTRALQSSGLLYLLSAGLVLYALCRDAFRWRGRVAVVMDADGPPPQPAQTL